MIQEEESLTAYWIRIWTNLLDYFLRWTPEKVEKWMKSGALWEDVHNPEDLIFHRDPFLFVVRNFIPPDLYKRLPYMERERLVNQMLTVFNDFYQMYLPKDIDWEPYRQKVLIILAEYGATLPIQQENEGYDSEREKDAQ
jgi:hypothetical protein